MKKILFAVAALIASLSCLSQQCGNCGQRPSVALYDLDVQVPQPELKGEKTQGWLEWQQLYWMARHLHSALNKNNAACVRFTQPASNDDDVLKVGLTYANLPAVNTDVSQYGNYIVTGLINKGGDAYVMHVEIQSACTRKKVASADVPFQSSAESSNTIRIANEAAARLSPLIEKIKKFELDERAENKKFAMAENIDLIKITPAKTKLVTGQQTDFTLELKDCDGTALAGREIVFTSDNIGGGNMPGTTGGFVTPSKVITDANGKATANFKMTAISGNPAIINAHTITQTPQTCAGVLFGDAQIDAMPSYKIVVSFSKTLLTELNMNSNEDGVVMKSGERKKAEVSYNFSLLHYISKVPKDGEQIMMMPQFENDPDYQKSMPGKTIVLHNDGYSEFTITDTALNLVKSPFGAPHSDDNVNRQRYFSSSPLPPAVSLMFKNSELVFFSASVEFPEREEGLSPVGGSFSIEKDNKDYFPLKAKKVTDPNSVYKWVYEFQYHRGDDLSKKGQVFNYSNTDGEGATIQIWKSF